MRVLVRVYKSAIGKKEEEELMFINIPLESKINFEFKPVIRQLKSDWFI